MEIIFNGAAYNLTNHLNVICLLLPTIVWLGYIILSVLILSSDDCKEKEKAFFKLLMFFWIPSILSTLYFIKFL